MNLVAPMEEEENIVACKIFWKILKINTKNSNSRNGADNPDCCLNGGRGQYCCTNGADNPECFEKQCGHLINLAGNDPSIDGFSAGFYLDSSVTYAGTGDFNVCW